MEHSFAIERAREFQTRRSSGEEFIKWCNVSSPILSFASSLKMSEWEFDRKAIFVPNWKISFLLNLFYRSFQKLDVWLGDKNKKQKS
mgnify:CR=1 FL=1